SGESCPFRAKGWSRSGWSLEVETQDQLDDAPARIVRRRSVAIRGIGTIQLAEQAGTEGRDAGAADADGVGRVGADLEVLVIDQVERFGAQLEVGLLRQPDLLDQARVHAQEARAVEHQVGEAAVASEALDAAVEVGRRDEASGRRAVRERARVVR